MGVLKSYFAHIVLYGVLALLAQVTLWAWTTDYRLRWPLAAAAVLETGRDAEAGRRAGVSSPILGATAGDLFLWT